MPPFETSVAFFGASLLLGLAPGPDIIFVLTQSALYGARAGIFTTCGLVTGLCFHILAVAVGLAALLAASPTAFTILKCLGALYLCYLAWLAFHAKADKTGTGQAQRASFLALYRRGIIMNITNPKVAIFFLAFLPQFCRADAGPIFLQSIWLGLLFMAATLCVFCPVAIMGGKLAQLFNTSPRAQILLNRVAAVVFLSLALGLILTDARL